MESQLQQERDDEQRNKIMLQEEKWKEEKHLDIHERNLISQQKCLKRIYKEEIKAGIRDESGKKI